ncbi:hypothetical protein FXO37_17848 [Capsicum annuum]|nr:hypothetical protein FXO37_17848 [Capsicum annuum]
MWGGLEGSFGDNGSLMYHHGYGYAAYITYSPATSPVPTVRHDGQLYGAQYYHYPYFQPVPPISTPYATSVTPRKGEISTSYTAERSLSIRTYDMRHHSARERMCQYMEYTGMLDELVGYQCHGMGKDKLKSHPQSGRQLTYPDVYDATDRIMDLNFYNNFKDRYAKLYKISDFDGSRFDQLVSTFHWDKKAIKYVRGKRSYPHGKSWTKAKRILTVMNVDVTHFLTIEILLYEGMIKVYDCNLPVFSEKMFLTLMQPLLKLLPKLLTQSKLMDDLPAEVLAKESWDFEGRNKNIQLPKNTTGAACGPYSPVYIECLLTGTQITDVCDTIMGKMQWVWVYGVLTKWLEPVYKKEHVQRQRRTQ